MIDISNFRDVTDKWNCEEGGERWLRDITDTCWISVLHRLTGFGYMEWETALCYRFEKPDGKYGIDCRRIVRGDHRETLNDMTQEQVEQWFQNDELQKNSFESVLEAIKKAIEDE